MVIHLLANQDLTPMLCEVYLIYLECQNLLLIQLVCERACVCVYLVMLSYYQLAHKGS